MHVYILYASVDSWNLLDQITLGVVPQPFKIFGVGALKFDISSLETEINHNQSPCIAFQRFFLHFKIALFVDIVKTMSYLFVI